MSTPCSLTHSAAKAARKLEEKENNVLWEERKKRVSVIIMFCLKDNTTTEVQIQGLIYNKDGKYIVITKFHGISKAWKRIPFEVERASQLNQILNMQFDKDKVHEFHI